METNAFNANANVNLNSNSNDNPTLLLMFDVNKTILMVDPVQGKSKECVLNEIMADAVLGRIVHALDHANNPSVKWVWDPKIWESNKEKEHQHEKQWTEEDWVNVVTRMVEYQQLVDIEKLHDYLDTVFHGTRNDRDDDFADNGKQMWVSYTQYLRMSQFETEESRDAVRSSFVMHDQPGSVLRPLYNILAKRLVSLPQQDDETKKSEMPKEHECGLVPSFYHLIHWLETQRGKNYKLVFRTFGDDILRIYQDFNQFAEGNHPFSHTHFEWQGQKNEIQYPLKSIQGMDRKLQVPQGIGIFKRGEQDKDVLVLGTIHESPNGITARDDVIQFYKEQETKPLGFANGLEEIYATIQDLLSRHCTLAFRDDYRYWNTHGETAEYGKLFVFDPDNSQIHPIFFDDKIGQKRIGERHVRAKIVDARHVHTKQHISFDQVKGIHLIKVEPLLAVLDPDFFVNKVQQAERSFQKVHHH